MTIPFKDSDGVEWRVLVGRYVGEVVLAGVRPATTADLLAALGQLSTESDGPTDEELLSIALDAHAHGLTDGSLRNSRRALFNAGLALGEQKQAARVAELESLAYLGDHHFPDLTYKVRCEELQSELAATKVKLAEVERERDELNWEASRRHEEGVKLRSELASARRVVEAAKHWASLDHDDGATYRECIEASKKLQAAAEAIASVPSPEKWFPTEEPKPRGGFNAPPWEPKPEPQPSGERPDERDPLPWRSDVYGRMYDANDHYVSDAPKTAAFIVARCNAQDEGLAEAIRGVAETWARYQRNDLTREEFEGFIAERFETSSPGYLLRPELRDSPASPQDDAQKDD